MQGLYGKALDDRFEKQAKAEFETFYTRPVLKTLLPIGKQAAEVYTRKLFSVSQDGIFESHVLAVKRSGNRVANTFEIARFDEEHKLYFVELDVSEQIANSSCKMFEFEGILCRHVIAVFKVANIFMLQQHYILKRWAKDAKDEAVMDVMLSVELRGSLPKGKNSYFDVLYGEAVKCAEEGMASDHSFKVALDVRREARINIVDAKKNSMNGPRIESMASTGLHDNFGRRFITAASCRPPNG